ncbi:unknown [Prevotella sp. CAG:1092]|nr:unknown [Prevotella sp. CAG:1092]
MRRVCGTRLSRVVVVGYVIVPQWSPINQRVGLFLIEICAIEAIYICSKLGAYIPICQRHAVYPMTIAFDRVGKVGRRQCFLKLCYIISDILVLRINNVFFIRIMDADRHIVGSGGETVAILETIYLEEISTCDV